MSTTDTRTTQPDTTGPDPRTETTNIPGATGESRPRRARTDDAPAHKVTSPTRIGAAFALAATIAVGALVWAVFAGPDGTSVDPSTHDRVESNRVGAWRDLAAEPGSSYDRVESNRVGTLRDIATRPSP